MPAEKISVTVDDQLMKWARSAAKKRGMTLSAMVAEALELQKQHQARERYLTEALAGLSASEIDRRTAKAFQQIFGQSDAAE
jgi:post-segregation antitoxin (ccd killing protein)